MKPAYHSRKYHLNESFFSDWNRDSAYVYGFWLADGSMRVSKSYRISFSSTEKDHLDQIKVLMKTNTPYEKNGNRSDYSLVLRSKQLYHDLHFLGGRPLKSNSIIFPKLSNDLYPDFIRGYFDGDGSVHRVTYKASKNNEIYSEIRSNFTSGSRKFLVSLQRYLHQSLHLKNRVIGQYGPNQFKLGYGQEDTGKLLKYIYFPGYRVDLKRKSDYLQCFA